MVSGHGYWAPVRMDSGSLMVSTFCSVPVKRPSIWSTPFESTRSTDSRSKVTPRPSLPVMHELPGHNRVLHAGLE